MSQLPEKIFLLPDTIKGDKSFINITIKMIIGF